MNELTESTAAQLGEDGRLRHLLTTEGLGGEMITAILDNAESFLPVPGRENRTLPLLRGRTVVNLFFEPSTRTRMTFELAAKRLAADVINLAMESSSRLKGEDDLDTLLTIQAMGVDLFVIRHPNNGAAAYFANQVESHVGVLNAGDGTHAHPTQALLDALTIRQHKPDWGNLSVAIVGDVLHSRVAHSNVHALKALGVKDIRIVAPESLMMANTGELGVTACHDLTEGVTDVDVVMTLRLQHERMHEKKVESLDAYHQQFGLTSESIRSAKPDAIIMHPGPINRGVEISDELAYSGRSVILQQVRNGIAIRMAIMAMALGAR